MPLKRTMPAALRKNRIALSLAARAGALTRALVLSAVPAIVAADSGAASTAASTAAYGSASAAVDPSTLKHKVLFGTDFPLFTPERWMADLEKTEVRDSVKPGIMLHNAARLFGIELPEPTGDGAGAR